MKIRANICTSEGNLFTNKVLDLTQGHAYVSPIGEKLSAVTWKGNALTEKSSQLNRV